MLETIRRIHPARFAQFGRQFDAGGAAADDDDIKPARAVVVGFLIVGHGQQFEQGQAEALGILGGIQGNRMFFGARHAKVIGDAAHRDHQLCIADLAFGQDLLARLCGDRTDLDGFLHRVHAGHGAVQEGKAIVVRQHLVRQAFLVHVERAGRHLVQ